MVTLRDRPSLGSRVYLATRLRLLRLLRKLDRADTTALADWSGMSEPMVAQVMLDLESSRLVEHSALLSGGEGKGQTEKVAYRSASPVDASVRVAEIPGSVAYRFRPAGVKSGAVLVSVDTVQVAVIDADGVVVGRVERPLGTDKRPAAVIDLIVATLQESLAELALTTRDLLGIGIGVPGLTSFHSGVVHFAPHLPDWSDVPLGPCLSERLGALVWVDNDSHVQALAERYFGLGQDGGEFVSVQSGMGLSAAFYLDGTLYRGPRDTAGEIGHMIVQEDGRLCDCGSWGCWETIASVTWLVDEACRAPDGSFRLPDWLDIPEFVDQDYQSIWDIDPAVVRLAAHAIFRAAHQGRTQAIDLVRQHGQYFGIGLANLANMLNPQRIIIWGDDIEAGQMFLETVRNSVAKRALKHPCKTCEIVFSPLGHDVALIGAGCLAIDALYGSSQARV
jgi:predicted NBD/HSP70 family sugar kinase